MKRREWMGWALGAPVLASAGVSAWAHHGWSSFDQNRPLFLAGRVARVRWQNPHAEILLDVATPAALPADLARRPLTAQTAPVPPDLLARTTLPTRRDAQWEIELAPLTRLRAWQVEPLAVGQAIEVVGFTFTDEKGDPVLRAEYLFVNGKGYGLRSSPA